jgi:uncharacterized cupin superfamily protein
MSAIPDQPFHAQDVPESNYTSLPAPFSATNHQRYNRRLGDHAGLKAFGVNLTRILPGGQSSASHFHSEQEEFIYVLEGHPTLETGQDRQVISQGMCVGFPAGTGTAHRFVNETASDVLLLVIGDRKANDQVGYPNIDLHGRLGPAGTYQFFHKDGTPY